jgi:two-component system chemotaxis response regulator CheB
MPAVLVVDDSAVVRGLLARALETDPAIKVAGTAMHGGQALDWMQKNRVDVVILDVEMPVMDGLTALAKIQVEFPHVHVVMASGLTYEGAETTVKALALGAAGCIAKPAARSTAESIELLVRELVPLVKALGSQHVYEAPVEIFPPKSSSGGARRPIVPPSVVVIGSSTGGPKALTTVLSGLPRDFPLPILIVQHMPPLFTPMLAKHLQQDSGRPCQEAQHAHPIERNHTYIAPGDYHVVIDKRDNLMVTTLNQNPAEHYCRPSVNPLFRSAADWYGKSVLAVMLTGMGDDGIEGTRSVSARQGYIIAQDQASSVVWGMPAAVVRENLAHQVLPLSEIAPAIQRICCAELTSSVPLIHSTSLRTSNYGTFQPALTASDYSESAASYEFLRLRISFKFPARQIGVVAWHRKRVSARSETRSTGAELGAVHHRGTRQGAAHPQRRASAFRRCGSDDNQRDLVLQR